MFSFPLHGPIYKQPCQQITCTPISNAFISLPLSLPSVLTVAHLSLSGSHLYSVLTAPTSLLLFFFTGFVKLSVLTIASTPCQPAFTPSVALSTTSPAQKRDLSAFLLTIPPPPAPTPPAGRLHPSNCFCKRKLTLRGTVSSPTLDTCISEGRTADYKRIRSRQSKIGPLSKKLNIIKMLGAL